MSELIIVEYSNVVTLLQRVANAVMRQEGFTGRCVIDVSL